MGMYDTMQSGLGNAQPAPGQGNSIQRAVPNAMGQGFAQQKPVQNYAAKQQMRANPMMQGKPAMAQGFGQPSMSQRPNPMTGARPAMGMQPGMQGGSRDAMKQKMLQLKNTQASAEGGAIGGSYNQLLSAHPELQSFRQTGQTAGQDMSWMDRPGALSMAPNQPEMDQSYGRPQSGLSPLQSPYERQIQESKPDAVMGAVQDGGAMGSMGRTFGRPMVMNRNNEGMTDLYGSGGIGPSQEGMTNLIGAPGMDQSFGQPMNQPPVQMDENGLEPRRGPR